MRRPLPSDLTHRSVLSSVDNRRLWDAFQDVRHHVAAIRDRQEVALVKALSCRPIGETLTERLCEFSINGNSSGALLLTGLDIPKMEPDGVAELYLDYVLLRLGLIIGLPYAYATRASSTLVDDVRPVKEDRDKELGTGSETGLTWHTEDAHTEHSCDYVLLLCIRGDPAASTLVASLNDDIQQMPELSSLKQNIFTIHSDESYQGTTSLSTPVIEDLGSRGAHRLRFDPLYTSSPDARALDELSLLSAMFDENHTEVCLEAGQILVLDNRISAHARTPFAPNFDRCDRWLKRGRFFKDPVPANALLPGRLVII